MYAPYTKQRVKRARNKILANDYLAVLLITFKRIEIANRVANTPTITGKLSSNIPSISATMFATEVVIAVNKAESNSTGEYGVALLYEILVISLLN